MWTLQAIGFGSLPSALIGACKIALHLDSVALHALIMQQRWESVPYGV